MSSSLHCPFSNLANEWLSDADEYVLIVLRFLCNRGAKMTSHANVRWTSSPSVIGQMNILFFPRENHLTARAHALAMFHIIFTGALSQFCRFYFYSHIILLASS